MPHRTLTTVLHGLSRLLDPAPVDEQGDGQLLTRFLSFQDQAAFASIVQRHGPLVLGLCRAILRDDHAADDAFQATFLVLARKASAIRKRQSLASFLYGVAYRTALRAKVQARARIIHESKVQRVSDSQPDDDLDRQEQQELLHEELDRLPEKYRAPLVLCYLQGKTHEEAARELGWSRGSMAGRLATARAKLAERLARRGLPAGVLAGVLACSAEASPAVSTVLLDTTVKNVALLTAGQAAAIAHPVAALACGVLRGMAAARLQMTLLLVLVVGLLIAGAGFWIGGVLAVGPAAAPPGEPARPAPVVRTDVNGDPLPAGALVRLGSIRLTHEDDVRAVAVAPDGKTLAVSGAGRSISLWDIVSARRLHRLELPRTIVSFLCFSPDGKLLVSGEHATVRVWDAATGKEIRRLPCGTRHWTKAAAFSADGKILTVLDERSARRWDVASWTETGAAQERPGVSNFPEPLLAPDGRSVCWHGGDSIVGLWDTATGKMTTLLKDNPAKVRLHSIAFSADGRTLMTSHQDKVARVWDVATGKELRRFPLDYGVGMAWIALSGDGKTVATASWDKPIDKGGAFLLRLLDSTTGKELRAIRPDPEQLTQGVNSNQMAFTPDGKRLLAWGNGSTRVHVWDTATGKAQHADDSPNRAVRQAAISPDGKTVVTLSTNEKAIRLWDADTGKEIRRLTRAMGFGRVVFSPDGRMLAAPDGANSKDISLWDLERGREVARLAGHAHGVTLLGFSADGKGLVSWAHDGTVRFWDVAGGKEVRQLKLAGGVVALSPEGKKALLVRYEQGSGKGTGYLRDLETNKEVRQLPTTAGDFSPDGRLLVGPDADGIAWGVWEVATGRLLRRLPNRYAAAASVAFSPDGRFLAFAEQFDDVVRLWDVPTGKECGRFATGQGGVLSVAFSGDGRRLVTGGRNATTLVWDVSAAAPPTAAASVERTAKELDDLWDRLAAEYSAAAIQATWDLVASPKQAVPLLREKLVPAPKADPQDIARWIADLDSERFEVRRKATEELEKLGELAETAVKKALEGKPSLEVRKRLEGILQKLATGHLQRARERRGVAVLETIGSTEARQHLEKLAGGRPGAPLTTEARAALQRLSGDRSQ